MEKFSLSESYRGNCKAEQFLAFINGQDKKKVEPLCGEKSGWEGLWNCFTTSILICCFSAGAS